LRLGFLTHVAGAGEAGADATMAETLRLIEIAERLGYESAWVAQHHLGAEGGVLPSPFVFLAAAAARTSRVRLGTGIVILPLEDPVRVAEDAAVADVLAGGRVELGVGTSAHQPSFTALGRDFEGRQAAGGAALRALLDALRGCPLPGGHTLVPAAPGLADRVWRATATAGSAAEAGREGLGLLLSRVAVAAEASLVDVQLPLAESYLAAYGEAGHAAPPRLGVTRTVYPAASRAAAAADLESGVRAWSREMPPFRAAAELPVEELFRRHSIVCGPAEEVAAALAADPVVRLATDLLVQVQPGLPGLERTAAALERVAAEVGPALGWAGPR
jgi:alkanesulfonate monooxygenase SsuD/methylene tetrahydromethanopterin reductase-like flavin-dependent oxidoreductase (luciferase family)